MAHRKQMREEKRQHILNCSRKVFSEKGYARVTMQDLVNASDISRGGIYLYFKSVEEVFRELLLQRERTLIEDVKKMISENLSFDDLFDAYLELQKKRLKHIEDSLIQAMYEYHFTVDNETSSSLRDKQVENAQETIRLVIHYGCEKGCIEPENVDVVVEHIMLTIEGLNIYALLGGLSPEKLQAQLDYLKVVVDCA